MNRIVLFLIYLFSFFSTSLLAQATFKAGWSTYPTAMIIHEYAYTLPNNDTAKLSLTDSDKIFISPDSLVTVTLSYPFRDKSVYKKIHYFNDKKQIARTEEYKDDNLLISNEWRYDDKNRKNFHYEDNKVTGNNFRKTYDYATDKKTGDIIVSENSYYNGRIEFYTKTYYDKHSVKYKEVRLNDNNKDVVHVESFFYGENGKLKERSVYFPEWKVTKKFEEKEGSQLPACYKSMPVGTAEKITIPGKVPVMKRLIARAMPLLMKPECDQFEYTFKNFTNCDIVISNSNLANTKKVVFRYKEKMAK